MAQQVNVNSRTACATDDRSFLVTHRLVLSIAIPMTLAYLTTPLLGLVDMTVVGQFGQPALLGGLAAGALVFDVVFTTFNFLRSGTTGLVSQAFGQRNDREEQAVFWRALIIAVGSGLVLVALAPLFAMLGARFIAADAEVTAALQTYVSIRFLAAPMSLANYVILGYVLGRGEGGLGLALQLLLNGSNIVLSVILGHVLGWGVVGVAWGTVGGECLAAAWGLAMVAMRFRGAPRLTREELIDFAAIRLMLGVSRDIMIRSFVLLAAFFLLTRQGAQLGTVTLAVNAVLMNFFLLGGYLLDGFATAAEQIAGRALGARDRTAFARGVRLTAAWGFALAGIATLGFLLTGRTLVAIMTTAPEIREMAADYLPWAALTALSGVLAFQMDGVFIGATWSRDMRNMMLVSFAVFASSLLVLVPLLGNDGLWAALHVFLVVRGLSLLAILPSRMQGAFSH